MPFFDSLIEKEMEESCILIESAKQNLDKLRSQGISVDYFDASTGINQYINAVSRYDDILKKIRNLDFKDNLGILQEKDRDLYRQSILKSIGKVNDLLYDSIKKSRSKESGLSPFPQKIKFRWYPVETAVSTEDLYKILSLDSIS